MSDTHTSKSANVTSWMAQIVAALIMGQTLFFKFSGAPEPIALFTQLGAEPWGRIGTGVLELIAVILLLTPRSAALGGLLGMGLMVGAVGAHLTKLGIVFQDDGGTLFSMALITLLASTLVTFIRRRQLPIIGQRLAAAQS